MGGHVTIGQALADRWGAVLHTRVPAFVRLCALESDPPRMVQLVNTWWRCDRWEAQR
ncbi:MAG: hypothetical protein ACU0BF_05340 [Paracoccaceae bacterium]